MRPRLVLLDRDGVLNQDRDTGIRSPEQLVMVPGSASAVARLNRAGILVCGATNQAVVGRGIIGFAQLDEIQDLLARHLAAAGARLDLLLVAPERPERATVRRKPNPGMLLDALARFGVKPEEAVFIGDQPTDAQAAERAGVRFLLVRTGKGRATEAALDPTARWAVVDDLAAAVDLILT